jgi:predicted DNA-binding protein with PD1-like motif
MEFKTMRIKATIFAVLAGLTLATTAARATDVQGTVEMITMADITMKDGTVMHAHIVKMGGKTYIMMSVDDLPDYLHQQVLKVMPQ